MSPSQFESRLRYDMSLQQLGRSVADTAIAPRSVTERLAALEGQKREVSELKLPAEQFMSRVTLDDAKLKTYYEGHAAEFRTPERVRAEYALLSSEVLARLEPATDDEIKAAFEARAAQFKGKEQRRASHILVKSKEEAEKIVVEVKKNPGRFGDLAKKNSTDTGSAEKGGDLGWFSGGMMVKPFEDAVFEMKKEGEIAGPVQSEFGFHVIRLTGIQAAKVPSFDEMRKDIGGEISRQKGAKKFSESAEAFGNLVY